MAIDGCTGSRAAVSESILRDAAAMLTKAPRRVGEAARNVATLLHPHFVKEEEYALPLVGEYVQAQLAK